MVSSMILLMLFCTTSIICCTVPAANVWAASTCTTAPSPVLGALIRPVV